MTSSLPPDPEDSLELLELDEELPELDDEEDEDDEVELTELPEDCLDRLPFRKGDFTGLSPIFHVPSSYLT